MPAIQRHHLEVWFGLNPSQLQRASSWQGSIRFDGAREAWPVRCDFWSSAGARRRCGAACVRRRYVHGARAGGSA
jgi:hypothetical protein